MLRNRLVHGGAAWISSVNRAQVGVGAAVLGVLAPVFIDIMMDNPGHDWGAPHYAVVEDSRVRQRRWDRRHAARSCVVAARQGHVRATPH